MPDFILPERNAGSTFGDMRGHHVAVRVQEFEVAKRWYVEKLDFHVDMEWPYGDMQLAYLSNGTAKLEVLGGATAEPPDGEDRKSVV